MASPFGLLGGAAGAAEGLKQLLAQRLAQQIADQRAQEAAAQLKQRQDEARQQSTYQLGQLDIDRMRENRLSQQEQRVPPPANWANYELGGKRYAYNSQDPTKTVALPGEASAQTEDPVLARQKALYDYQLQHPKPEPKRGGVPRVVNTTTPDGQNITQLVDNEGNVLFTGATQLPGGMKAAQAEQGSLNDQIDYLLTQGEQSGWKGTGLGTAAVKGFIKKATGYGSDSEDALRVGLDALNADIAHGKYGAAFTATEKAQLANYAPKSNMAGEAIKNRLLVMKRQVAQRTAEIKAGQTPTPLQLPADSGPAGPPKPAQSKYKVTVQ